MQRRRFLEAGLVSAAALVAHGVARSASDSGDRPGHVMTVAGPIAAAELGLTLVHEHLYADLRPYAEQIAQPLRPDIEAVGAVALPQLLRIRRLGCRSLVDCTATTLGREPALLRQLAQASGLQVLTTTGVYLAAGGRFTPPYAVIESSRQLAARWMAEWEHGIAGTGVRPGLIKLGVEGDPLTEVERKALAAAGRVHARTGLLIAVHTGPWGEVAAGRNARCALAQLDVLQAAGVPASAWAWVHAQNEVLASEHLRVARRGGWISFDGFRPGQAAKYVALLAPLRDAGLLGQVLVSQDAGWYTAGVPGGGEFKPFDPILLELRPALRRAGFSAAEVDMLFIANPARALAFDQPRR